VRFLPLERAGGAPAELYQFHRGSTSLARWTSADVARTVEIPDALDPIGGSDPFQFLPAPITREQVEGTDERSGTGLKVMLPAGSAETTDTIVGLYRDGPPASPVELSLYRVHRGSGDVRRIFFGDVTGAEFEAGVCTLNCEPKHAALQHPILRQLWQGPCNNQLGDSFCGVNLSAFNVAGTVDTISADGLTITVPEAAALADGYFAAGGKLIFGARIGFLVGHVGDTLTLFRRVPGLVAGSSVTLQPGCDRTHGTCDSVFSNAANHMGFPLIPSRDPFKTSVG
jgi:hypothetical protein